MEMSDDVVIDGYLSKWVNYIRGYKKRYFILKDGTLTYYKNKKSLMHENSAKSSVQLKNPYVSLSAIDEKTIRISQVGKRSLYIKINPEIKAQIWKYKYETNEQSCGTETQGVSRVSIEAALETMELAEIKMKNSYDALVKKNEELVVLMEELENFSYKEFSKKPKNIKEKLKDSKDASNAFINITADFTILISRNIDSWSHLMAAEYEKRCRLEKMVQQLAKQIRNLEAINSVSNGEEVWYDVNETDSPSVVSNNFRLNSVAPVNAELGRVAQAISIRKSITRRTTIPPRPVCNVSLWSILKNAIGKDLTKIALPVNFSEPISMLQRLAEDFYYSSCLDRAACCASSTEQMAHVAAFSVSTYASSADRINKPFNPLLGETYECDRTDDYGWRFFAEQISHHPPVSASHCESANWSVWQEFSINTKFRGKYIQVDPIGTTHLLFSQSGHHYTWQKCSLTVHNIVVGKLWIENYGDVTIVNHTTGDKCVLSYKPYSYFSSEKPNKVKGVITNSKGVECYILNGFWNQKMEMTDVSTNVTKTIWQVIPLQPDAHSFYNFNLLSIQLNEMEDGVAPTDSRHRLDQRYLEIGDSAKANSEKVRLEADQRSRLKLLCKSNDGSLSSNEDSDDIVWFTQKLDPYTNKVIAHFNFQYWTHKQKQDWSICPKIF